MTAERMVDGIKLTQTADGWTGWVDGIEWFFLSRGPELGWGGYTAGHQTGLPTHRTLGQAIAWIRRHSVDIREKVASRPARA